MKKPLLFLWILFLAVILFTIVSVPLAHSGPMLNMVTIEAKSPGQVKKLARMGIDMARNKGIKVGFLRLVVVWPFPEKRIAELAGQVKAFVVPEINLGQMVLEVERCSAGKAPAIHVPHAGGGVHNPQSICDAIVEAAR